MPETTQKDEQLEADYQRDKPLVEGAATIKQVYRLGWLRGQGDGLNKGMARMDAIKRPCHCGLCASVSADAARCL